MLKIKKQKGYPSFLLNNENNTDLSENETTLYRKILSNSLKHMESTAFILGEKKFTHGELIGFANRFADILYNSGVRKGNTIICNVINKFLVTGMLLGCSKIGVKIITPFPGIKNEQLEQVSSNEKISYFFCSEVLVAKFASMNSFRNFEKFVSVPMAQDYVTDWRSNLPENASGIINWHEFMSTRVTEPAVEVHDKKAPLIFNPSTGTTGEPKLITHTNESALNFIHIFKEADPGWKQNDIFCSIIPYFSVTGMLMYTIPPLNEGAVIVDIIPKQESTMAAKQNDSYYQFCDIMKYTPEHLVASKSMLISLILDCKEINFDLSTLKHVIIAGEPVNKTESDIINDWLASNKSPAKLENMYGLSECMLATYHKFNSDSPVSMCRMMPHTVVSVFDDVTQEECPYGTAGRIYIHTPSAMKEYLLNPKATNDMLNEDEESNIWVKTEDMGYVTENNEVEVYGRFSDSFTDDNGNKIYHYMLSNELLNDTNIISCKFVTRNTDNGPKLAAHILVNEIPEDQTAYAKKLNSMLKESEKINVYPDLYKFRLSMPVVRSKVSNQLLAAEQDGFIDASEF